MAKPNEPTGGGYGRPPKHTQFKKGQSGNPKGRPKGSKSLDTMLVESVSERVTINESGTPRKVSKLAAMHKQLANKGALGDLRALQMILQKLESIEKRTQSQSELFDQADLDVIKELRERLKYVSSEDDNDGPAEI